MAHKPTQTVIMTRVLVLVAAFALAVGAAAHSKEATAADVLRHAYLECVQYGSLSCVKPKLLAFISTAVKHDQIPVTKASLTLKNSEFKFYKLVLKNLTTIIVFFKYFNE